VSELKNEGAIPVLYSRKCAEGEHCSACKWDSESELRKKWPELPPCFKVAMDEDAQWEEMRRESDAIPAAQEEGQESKEDEQKEEEHDQGQGEEEEEEEEDDNDDDDDDDDEEEEEDKEEEEEEEEDELQEDEQEENEDEQEEGESKKKEKKKKDKMVMMTVTGKQKKFYDYYIETLEVGLAHSVRCNWTTHMMRRKKAHLHANEIMIETDFSADLELRPQNAECCKWYLKCSLIPFVVHYTDQFGERKTGGGMCKSSSLAERELSFIFLDS
jgi:hypothetical protein